MPSALHAEADLGGEGFDFAAVLLPPREHLVEVEVASSLTCVRHISRHLQTLLQQVQPQTYTDYSMVYCIYTDSTQECNCTGM